MSVRCGKRFVALAVALLAFGAPHFASDAAAEDTVQIVATDQPTNFFGGEQAALSFTVHSKEGFTGKVTWRLAAANRTLARGEQAISLEPGDKRSIDVQYTMPPVKEGIVFPLELEATALGRRGSDPMAQLKLPLYLFAENPFADRQKWLEALKIKVFDPAEKTAAALTALEVPFDPVTNLDTLTDLESGVLIVGEGFDWEDYAELGSLLLEAARRGVFVICLAPSSGALPLPLATSEANSAQRFTLGRIGAIRELDKRFSTVWQAKGKVQTRNLEMVPNTETPTATFAEPGRGWPWAEIHFAKPTGRLIWCGFGLVRSWDQSPTPRYLLAKLLETYPSKVMINPDSNPEGTHNE